MNSGDGGKLYRGAVNVEAVGSGDVAGPASSTDEAIARFDLATGKLLQNSSVLLSDVGDISAVNSETFVQAAANPGGVDTLWLNSGDGGKLYRGAVNVEAVGSGDVAGPASSTDEAIARFDLATGKLLQNSSVLLSDAGDISALNSETFIQAAANPGGVDTLWLNSGDGGKLYRGAVSLEAGGSGDVVGPASSTNDGIARFDLATGKLLQNSTSTLTDAGVMDLKGSQIEFDGIKFIHRDGALNSRNTSVGENSLVSLTTGTYNTACGSETLFDNSTGSENSAFGRLSLRQIETGSDNTALGHAALQNLITGDHNLAVGHQCAQGLSSGSNNVIVGRVSVGGSVSDSVWLGDQNVHTSCRIGGIRGVTPVLGPQMVTIGTDGEMGSQVIPSGTGDVVGPASSTDNGIARFDLATGKLLQDSTSTLSDAGVLDLQGDIIQFSGADFIHNKGGLQNVSVGLNALSNITIGTSNTAIGHDTLTGVITTTANTAVGTNAAEVTNGTGNTAVGSGAFLRSVVGDSNTCVGVSSLTFGTALLENTAVGADALKNTTGDNNNAFGFGAGVDHITGSNNLYIDNVGIAVESSTIRVGTSQTSCFVKGIQGVTPALSPQMVTIGTDGELGSQAIPAAGSYTVTNIDFAASPYTVLLADEYIFTDTSGGVVTVNLPSASILRKIRVASQLGSNTTMVCDGADTVKQAASITMGANSSLSLVSDGVSKWFVVA